MMNEQSFREIVHSLPHGEDEPFILNTLDRLDGLGFLGQDLLKALEIELPELTIDELGDLAGQAAQRDGQPLMKWLSHSQADDVEYTLWRRLRGIHPGIARNIEAVLDSDEFADRVVASGIAKRGRIGENYQPNRTVVLADKFADLAIQMARARYLGRPLPDDMKAAPAPTEDQSERSVPSTREALDRAVKR